MHCRYECMKHMHSWFNICVPTIEYPSSSGHVCTQVSFGSWSWSSLYTEMQTVCVITWQVMLCLSKLHLHEYDYALRTMLHELLLPLMKGFSLSATTKPPLRLLVPHKCLKTVGCLSAVAPCGYLGYLSTAALATHQEKCVDLERASLNLAPKCADSGTPEPQVHVLSFDVKITLPASASSALVVNAVAAST